MWNVLLCFKKAAFVPPPGSDAPCGFCLQVLKVFSWSKLTLVLKCCSVHHYEKPLSVSYSHLNHVISAPQQGQGCSERRQPLEKLEFRLLPTWSQQLRDVPIMTQAAPADPWEATAPWHRYFWTSHWQNKQIVPFWIQLPFSPLGKYKLKLILTGLNNSTCTITAAPLPPTMRNAV